MSDFTSSDREVIRFLFSKRNWVDLYDLHVEFGLSPAQVLDMLERLLAVGLAERQGAQGRLTQQGRDWVLTSTAKVGGRPANNSLPTRWSPQHPTCRIWVWSTGPSLFKWH